MDEETVQWDMEGLREELKQALRERDEARGVARRLMPHRRAEDPHSVRWQREMLSQYPWLEEPDA